MIRIQFRVCYAFNLITSTSIYSHIKESILSSHLKLTEQDFKDIDEVLKKRRGPKGEVYELERKQEGPHGRIMKYNLSQLNGRSHFEELCTR